MFSSLSEKHFTELYHVFSKVTFLKPKQAQHLKNRGRKKHILVTFEKLYTVKLYVLVLNIHTIVL